MDKLAYIQGRYPKATVYYVDTVDMRAIDTFTVTAPDTMKINIRVLRDSKAGADYVEVER